MLTNSLTTKAEPITCSDVLKLCDKALEDERTTGNKLRKLNHEQQVVIKAQDDLIGLQRVKIDQQNSILRSPYLWGIVGVITGILLVK